MGHWCLGEWARWFRIGMSQGQGQTRRGVSKWDETGWGGESNREECGLFWCVDWVGLDSARCVATGGSGSVWYVE